MEIVCSGHFELLAAKEVHAVPGPSPRLCRPRQTRHLHRSSSTVPFQRHRAIVRYCGFVSAGVLSQPPNAPGVLSRRRIDLADTSRL